MADFIYSAPKVGDLSPVYLSERTSSDSDPANGPLICFADRYVPPAFISSSSSSSSSSSAAAAVGQNIQFPLYQETLSNGLQVFISPNEIFTDVSVKVYFKAGSMQEDSKLTEVAHIFEHFMGGKGSREIRTTNYAAEEKELTKARQINAEMVALRCGNPKPENADSCSQLQIAMNRA